MNRIALIAAASVACSIGITPALGHDGRRAPGYGPWGAPVYRYYAPRAYFAPRYGPGPYAYGYYDPYWIYPPPPPPPPAPAPVVVERIYEPPPLEEPPPPVHRRYAENAPPPPVAPPPTSRPATPAPRLERYTLSARELFGFDEATIRGSNGKLDEIAQAMKRNPQIDHVTITGYTDRLGGDAYNMKLSRRRAEAVKSYLVARGVEARRLTAVGKGKANPVVQCNDRDRKKLIRCLEPNRRVEVEQIVVERGSR